MKRATRLVAVALQSRPIRPTPFPAYRPFTGPSIALLSLRFASTTTSSTAQAEPQAEDLPTNVSFEGISEEADEEIERALLQRDAELDTWFPTSSGRYEPVLLPISSLTSSTPTLPSDSDIVIALPPDVFAQPIRKDILHRCVVWYLSQLRSGTKMTKSRSTVNYSGRKLIPQKGTGKARAGDASSGVRRGGAPIHPIYPKNWAQLLPRKIRELGMRISLSTKLESGLLRVVQDLNEAGWNGTNEAKRALADAWIYPRSEEDSKSTAEDVSVVNQNTVQAEEKVNEEQGTVIDSAPIEVKPALIPRFGSAKDLSILFLYSPFKPEADVTEFIRVVRNIPGVKVLSADEAHVYDILKYRWLVMEGGAVDWFTGDVLGADDFGFEQSVEDDNSEKPIIA
ncbi:50S ribosomal protein L4 [Cryptococcus depauperatus]|nr:50S ribosomal protein L4 [Cryptococcus depauperatus CBS 7855]